jgi:HD-like signal output (HDOD) protein
MPAAILHIDLDALPPLSPLAGELLQIDWRDDDADRRLARIIGSEPQLAARIVGLASSVAFGAPGSPPVGSVAASLQRIGLRRAKLLSVGALFGHPISHRLPAQTARALWLHALTMAAAAEAIARRKQLPDPDPAHLLGLLHDLGYMLMEYSKAGALAALARGATTEGIPIEDAERRLFGADHAELTGHLLDHWEVPDDLIEPVLLHHSQGIAPNGHAALLLGAERLLRAEELVTAFGTGESPRLPLAVADRKTLLVAFERQLELGEPDLDWLIGRITDAIGELQANADAMAAVR